ncbi:MAG: glucose-1-phosphate adenylyltransferase subunit GlgD [Christensenellales bacterium]|jgi:glucose-1-phosphate adenylyltransferase
MVEVMGIIFASDNENKLNELTLHRTTASLPFLGRYRLIDFTLSNFVNSGITKIGIITKNNYNSLMDHLRMGRDWDLNRKNSGITLFPPYALNTSRDVYKGKVDALYGISHYIKHNREDYVILTNSNVAMNIDFDDVYETHIQSGADITVLTHEALTTTSRRVVIACDRSNRIKDMYISEMPDDKPKLLGLNTYLMKKDILIDLIEGAYARGYQDLEKEVFLKILDNYKFMCYKVESYVAVIDDVKSYFNESMKLLDTDIRNNLFYGSGTIFTKVKDSVPTIYEDNAEVKNSLIADGCVIDGTVENSILFRGVTVAKGAVIKNSIVMENTSIGSNSMLIYTITDKNVTIRENKNISGYQTYPIVIVKDKTV